MDDDASVITNISSRYFSEDERQMMSSKLNQKLSKGDLAHRPGPGMSSSSNHYYVITLNPFPGFISLPFLHYNFPHCLFLLLGGQQLSYVEAHRVIELANDIFGFNNWSSALIDLTQDYVRPVCKLVLL